MSGWIKAHRVMTTHPIWSDKPFARGQAWIDLVLLASYKDSGFEKRGVWIDLKRGQVGRSVKGLADRWKWSQGKVERFLKRLKMDNQIEYQKNNITTIITIGWTI